MVSDAEIVRHLTAVLKKADLNTTTTTAIRVQLQSDLGVDFSDKEAFIREQVDLYLQRQSQEQQEGGEGEGSEEGEDERGAEPGAGEAGNEEEEDGDGDDEEDENDSRRTSRSSKTRGEPDSERMQAKIDRAIEARYYGTRLLGFV